MRWYAQDEVNQESEHNEVDGMKKGVDSTGEVMHNEKVGNLQRGRYRWYTAMDST